MALRLTCPNCGSRPYTEFWFGGEFEVHAGAVELPAIASEASREAALEADFARVWLRRNSSGRQSERWFHHAGCRRWHTAIRDTLTNELHESG